MSSSNHSQFRRVSQPTYTRTTERRSTLTGGAGTTPYTGGDAIVETLKFDNLVERSHSVNIIGGSIQSSKRDSVEVFRLHLYAKEPTAFADRTGVSAPRAAEREFYLGNITFTAAANIGATGDAYASLASDSTPFHCFLPSGKLWGVLEGTLGETPVSQQVYTVSLIMELN